VTDATPAAAPAYEAGNFDGYAVQATVTNGLLSIAPATGAFHAKLCFVEIGQAGTTISQATSDRLAALITTANAQTGASPEPVERMKEFVYGGYVDEVVAYQQTVNGVTTRYYPHYNHLYSVAALTNAAGAVVERYMYDSYGKQKIFDASGNVTRAKSAVGWDRGFTGYVADSETSLLVARSRMYSPALGRFVGRDPWMRNDLESHGSVDQNGDANYYSPKPLDGYVDGSSLYNAYYVPNKNDPTGMDTKNWCCPGGKWTVEIGYGTMGAAGLLLSYNVLRVSLNLICDSDKSATANIVGWMAGAGFGSGVSFGGTAVKGWVWDAPCTHDLKGAAGGNLGWGRVPPGLILWAAQVVTSGGAQYVLGSVGGGVFKPTWPPGAGWSVLGIFGGFSLTNSTGIRPCPE
jgi:RHS repeat-associated protein